ncbi:MAG: DnaJ domain-containing protein [Fimbriimonadaceae bacterium]
MNAVPFIVAVPVAVVVLNEFGARLPELPIFILWIAAIIAVVMSRKSRKAASAQASHHAFSSSPGRSQTYSPPPNTHNVDEAVTSPPKPRRTTVSSEYIQMEIDLNTNMMSGVVLKGSYATHELASLSLDVLIDLWREVAKDTDSRLLLEGFLERNHPQWRAAAASQHREEDREQDNSGRAMKEKEAYEILGLQPGASIEEINAKHRAAMKRNHPDSGGTNRLAALINEAKEVLGGKNRNVT